MESLVESHEVSFVQKPSVHTEEYTLSGDFILPEICPDIAVLLHTDLVANVHNRQWNGNRFLIDGEALVQVSYLDETKQSIRYAEFSQPFATGFSFENDLENRPVFMSITPLKVSCSASSPRRLTMNGTFFIRASVVPDFAMEIPTFDNAVTLCSRYVQTQAGILLGAGEKVLTLREVVDFPENLPESEMLYHGNIRATITETKAYAGKMIVKGNVEIHQLYTDDSVKGSTQVLDVSLPYSQMLDMGNGGFGEDEPFVHTACQVLDSQIHACPNPEGQNACLSVEVRLLIQAQAYGIKPLELLQNAYDLRYPLVKETKKMEFAVPIPEYRQTVSLSKMMDMPYEELSQIADVWVEPQSVSAMETDNGTKIMGKMKVQMLVRLNDGHLAFYERLEDWETPVENTVGNGDIQVVLESRRYTVNGGKLDLRTDFQVTVYGWQSNTVCAIQSLSPQTDKPYESTANSVRIYYAKQGESLFSIGEKCHVMADSIKAENDLSEEVLSVDTPLLIAYS